MNQRVLLAVLVGVFCQWGPSAAPGGEYRIETDVFVGGGAQPIAQNLTLFTSGLIYDFSLLGPEEITVFDPGRGRFVLLDAQRQVKATLSTQELLEFTASLKANAKDLDGPFAFAANPKFEESHDPETDTVTLSSRFLTYRAQCAAPKTKWAVGSYREFADWYARLNFTRPGSLPPFARLELNRAISERDQVPEEIVLTIEPETRFLGKKVVIRSRHMFNWILSNTDRKRIESAGNQMAEFQPVSLDEYRQAPQVAKR